MPSPMGANINVNGIMRKTLACCLPETPLRDVAKAMVEHNCGAIPVVETKETMRLIGILTDRDIVCRTVAVGKNPLEMTVKQCMSSPVVVLAPEVTLEECCRAMAENQVRRIPVSDERGRCVGLVTQAHVVRHATDAQMAAMLRDVSRPTVGPSSVATLG
jgi:CBS domain-containing protein